MRLRDITHIVLLSGSMTVLSCRSSDDTPPLCSELPAIPADAKSTESMLAMALVDRGYTISKMHAVDPRSGSSRCIAGSESGDPRLVPLGSGALALFNRKATQLNMRFGARTADGGVEFGSQLATPQAAGGDPHDALSVDQDRVLLAMNTSGKLIVASRTSGALLQDVRADWDFSPAPADAPLRPISLWRTQLPENLTSVGTGTLVDSIIVVHQGLDANYQPNGSQRIFVLSVSADGIAPRDLDPSAPGVQGIALNFSNPGQLVNVWTGKPLLVSLCYGNPECRSGVEQFDPATLSVASRISLDSAGMIGNGSLADGNEPLLFHAAMAAGFEPEAAKWIVRIDASKESIAEQITKVHTFPAGSSGSWFLQFDRSSGRLWVGDAAPDATGILSLHDPGEAQVRTTNLPMIPASGAFVAP